MLPSNKAYGFYSCPVKLLKMGKYIISEPLADIFNQYISYGIYPNKLKLAKIIPIFKGDDATEANLSSLCL